MFSTIFTITCLVLALFTAPTAAKLTDMLVSYIFQYLPDLPAWADSPRRQKSEAEITEEVEWFQICLAVWGVLISWLIILLTGFSKFYSVAILAVLFGGTIPALFVFVLCVVFSAFCLVCNQFVKLHSYLWQRIDSIASARKNNFES
jgi:hypothetical protein